MKKFILILICIVILSLLAGCTASHYKKNNEEYYLGFILIKHINDTSHICYDLETKICYVIAWDNHTYGKAISPYYVLVDNTPVIAVYGENYTGK